MLASDEAAAATDWPAFSVVEAGDAPVLVVCDHASNAIPPEYDNLGLPPEALQRHIAWDIGAAAVSRLLARKLGGQALLCGTSRLVIDCNRFPGHAGSIVAVSDGIAIPGNADIPPAEAERRHARYFQPYHAEMARRVAALSRGDAVPVIVSVHSFTPRFGGVDRPWHVGILWDPADPRLAPALLDRLRRRGDLVVGDNEPYSAVDPPGYSIKVFGEDAGIPMAVFEVRQDLIEDDAGAARWAAILAEALREPLADPALYRRRRR